jgi:hypothetical protein
MNEEPRLIEVQFEGILAYDGPIVCEHWVLSNSTIKHGVDFTKPMMLDKFLRKIGKCYNSINCASILKDARWFIYTCDEDDTIEMFFKPIKKEDKI